MKLGAFSVSLTVSDLERSRAFYETLGFAVTGGDAEQGWLILVNAPAVIGLFHGMFDKNILTFNPGLDPTGGEAPIETDVREIQQLLQDAGVELTETADPDSTGPAHIVFTDPDGNVIMVDQFR